MNDFLTLMNLQKCATDSYLGSSPEYPWGSVYGGQIVAQALKAALLTVDSDRAVHSLHAYFVGGAVCDEPIRYEVERTRSGGSFDTRSVTVYQTDRLILKLLSSFHTEEKQIDVQFPMLPQDAGSPEGDLQHEWSPLFERQYRQPELGRSCGWLRLTDSVGDDLALQSCALAYVSDDLPFEAVGTSYPNLIDFRDGWAVPRTPDFQKKFLIASLDHSIWFHRQSRVDQWQFYDYRSSGLNGGRGTVFGRVFSSEGDHVATVIQEILLREKVSC